jgi:hypothetical protein
MRKHSLRHTANRYLKMDNRGQFKDKQHRAFVIHKMIDDLFIIGDTPAAWNMLTTAHIQNLIQHWYKRKIKSATIMRYMTTIRHFLSEIDCQLTDIDNQNLGLTRRYNQLKKVSLEPALWQAINEPIVRLIIGLQIQFGLTFSEAIHFVPDIHQQEDALWITREIAFNSLDRLIPLRNDMQKNTLAELNALTSGSQSLAQRYGSALIRAQWHRALTERSLPAHQSFRYLYAQQLKMELVPILGNYQTSWLIHDEMGIKSRNTLWLYLNE